MRGTINLPTATTARANWSGSGADPETGFVYVPSKTSPGMMTLTPLPDGPEALADRCAARRHAAAVRAERQGRPAEHSSGSTAAAGRAAGSAAASSRPTAG